MNKIKLIYIAGSGRSGSTMLDLLLNSHEDIFSCGELQYIWDRAFIYNELCGCGKNVADCDVWTSIKTRAVDFGLNLNNLDEVVRIRKNVSKIRGLFLLLFLSKKQVLVDYKENFLTPVYNAISDCRNESFILDSSKNFGHLYLLTQIHRIDLYVIHLIRDSRAVSYSWSTSKQRIDSGSNNIYMPKINVFVSSLQWVIHNLLIKLISCNSKYLMVRYEDIVTSPQHILEKITIFLNLDFGFNYKKGIELPVNHTIAGNPLRLRSGFFSVRSDSRWVEHMSKFRKLIVTFLTFPFLVMWKNRNDKE